MPSTAEVLSSDFRVRSLRVRFRIGLGLGLGLGLGTCHAQLRFRVPFRVRSFRVRVKG